MTSWPEEMVLRIWVFDRWRRSWVFYRWGVQLSFSDLDQQRWIDIVDITRCAARRGRVSIVWLAKTFKNFVSLLELPWTVRMRNERVHLYLYVHFLLLLWLISLWQCNICSFPSFLYMVYVNAFVIYIYIYMHPMCGLTILRERRRRGHLYETFSIINRISNYAWYFFNSSTWTENL